MSSFIFAFLMACAVFIGTAAILGWKKAITYPGGAVSASLIFPPFYVAILGALAGHVICSFVIYHFKERKKFEWTKSMI